MVFAKFVNELAKVSNLVFKVGDVVIRSVPRGFLSTACGFSAIAKGSRHGIVRMLIG